MLVNSAFALFAALLLPALAEGFFNSTATNGTESNKVPHANNSKPHETHRYRPGYRPVPTKKDPKWAPDYPRTHHTLHTVVGDNASPTRPRRSVTRTENYRWKAFSSLDVAATEIDVPLMKASKTLSSNPLTDVKARDSQLSKLSKMHDRVPSRTVSRKTSKTPLAGPAAWAKSYLSKRQDRVPFRTVSGKTVVSVRFAKTAQQPTPVSAAPPSTHTKKTHALLGGHYVWESTTKVTITSSAWHPTHVMTVPYGYWSQVSHTPTTGGSPPMSTSGAPSHSSRRSPPHKDVRARLTASLRSAASPVPTSSSPTATSAPTTCIELTNWPPSDVPRKTNYLGNTYGIYTTVHGIEIRDPPPQASYDEYGKQLDDPSCKTVCYTVGSDDKPTSLSAEGTATSTA